MNVGTLIVLANHQHGPYKWLNPYTGQLNKIESLDEFLNGLGKPDIMYVYSSKPDIMYIYDTSKLINPKTSRSCVVTSTVVRAFLCQQCLQNTSNPRTGKMLRVRWTSLEKYVPVSDEEEEVVPEKMVSVPLVKQKDSLCRIAKDYETARTKGLMSFNILFDLPEELQEFILSLNETDRMSLYGCLTCGRKCGLTYQRYCCWCRDMRKDDDIDIKYVDRVGVVESKVNMNRSQNYCPCCK